VSVQLTPIAGAGKVPALALAARRRPRIRGRFWRPSRLALEIVATHSGLFPASPEHITVLGGGLTSTEVAVVIVGTGPDRPCAVIKMPMNPVAAAVLEREALMLTMLHADPRLGQWRELLPHPHVNGELRGQPYRIDSALLGWPILERASDDVSRRKLLRAAADAIAILHSSTAALVTVDDAVLERWVDVHIRELTERHLRWSALRLRLERLREELYEALDRRRLSASWIHGDYWLGNLLFPGPDCSIDELHGIVDWEASTAVELPLHDLLHLLLSTRRLRTGRELGHIICEQLRRPQWSAEEDLLLKRYGSWSQEGGLSDRHALLLYWLRHVAMHMRQQSAPGGWRCRWWQRRNVLPVLELLWP